MVRFVIYLLLMQIPLYAEDVKSDAFRVQKKVMLLPSHSTTLYSKVAGRISFLAENRSCQKLKEGDLLVELEDLPFIIALNEAKLNLKKALLELKQEEGKKIIAEKEWVHIESRYKSCGFDEGLALRTLHIEEKQASVQLAENKLEKAIDDFEATKIRASENDLIAIKYFVELGQSISEKDKLASLISVENLKFEIIIPMEQAKKLFQRKPTIIATLKQPFEGSPFQKKRELAIRSSDIKPIGFDAETKTLSLSITFKNPFDVCSKEEINTLFSFPFIVRLH